MSAARCRSFCAPVETSPKVSASAGNAPAEALELLRVLEEIDHLLEFLLGLVHAGHVVKGDADLALGIDLRPVPPEPAQRQHALARAQLLEHEPPDEPHDADGQDPDEERSVASISSGTLQIVWPLLYGSLRRSATKTIHALPLESDDPSVI